MPLTTNTHLTELRSAYRQLGLAWTGLAIGSDRLEKAGWTVAANEMDRTAGIVLDQLRALELFATGLGVTL